MGRGRPPPSPHPVRRGDPIVRVALPSLLATQADGRRSFDVEGETLGEALRALPVADLLFSGAGDWRAYLNVYVDGTDARDRGGLACSLADVRDVRIVAMLSGG